MYTILSVSTLVYIRITAGIIPMTVVSGFAVTAGIIVYLLGSRYSLYQVASQKIENDLVAKINFIEAHKTAISLMGASGVEYSSVIHKLNEANHLIPKLSLVFLFGRVFDSLFSTIASKFLGSYYTDSSIKNFGTNEINFINVMIMSLLINIEKIVFILTNNYSYIKLNLE